MNEHSWYMPGRVDGDTIVWSTHSDPHSWTPEGWTVEEDDGRFEVYYHSNERMRLSADGVLSFGRPEGYWFNTREWAELCAERLNSLDRAFQRSGPFIITTGSLLIGTGFGIGTSSPQYKFHVTGQQAKPLVSLSQSGEMFIDVPGIVGVWWRGTSAYRAWRKLMWGEKA